MKDPLQQLSFLVLMALLRLLQSPLVSFATRPERWGDGLSPWSHQLFSAVTGPESNMALGLLLSLYQQCLFVRQA